MREIAGDKYKLAGIGVAQKGTLVDVFAKFCGVDETLASIRAQDAKPKKRKQYPEGSVAAMLNSMPPMPREYTLPTLSTEEILAVIVGKRDISARPRELQLVDNSGVIRDLGPEKLAQVLVEMGEVRKQVLAEGFYTFVEAAAPATAEQAPEKPAAKKRAAPKA